MIRWLARLYWNAHYSLENTYFKNKYSKLPPKIYYDKRYRVFINPANIGETNGCVVYVCGETAKTSLLYRFSIGSKIEHEHAIDRVLQAAYNDAEQFSVPFEYEAEYSAQELDFIHKLIAQGKKDRGKH